MKDAAIFSAANNGQPLYYNLYSHYLQLIRSGAISPGDKLPGKRTAAARFGVSVNTVNTAYQMLAAEGYVTAVERSGFVVNQVSGNLSLPGPPAASLQAAENGGAAPAEAGSPLSFSSGGANPELFPLKTWARLSRETLSQGPALFASGDWRGEPELRREIAAYLTENRGAKCEAGQIVIGAGLEVLVGMLARLFPGKRFGVENPGYLKTGQTLSANGAVVVPLPVDAQGLVPQALAKANAQLVYLTPSHQFPTGAVMPVGRRIAMLEWAQRTGGYILEDDYDSEFRFDGRPLPCLQGLDSGGCVIYAGTFSRSLAHGLRIAYLALPPGLAGLWKAQYGTYSCTVSRPEQHTMARFLGGGHFTRSINRARNYYRQSRNQLISALSPLLPTCQFLSAHTGLYLLLQLPGPFAAAASEAAGSMGLLVQPLSRYYAPSLPPGGQSLLLLGYGGLTAQTLPRAAALLARAIAQAG